MAFKSISFSKFQIIGTNHKNSLVRTTKFSFARQQNFLNSYSSLIIPKNFLNNSRNIFFTSKIFIPDNFLFYSRNFWSFSLKLTKKEKSSLQKKLIIPTTLKRFLFITTKETPNPDSLKFYPGVPILNEGQESMNFPSSKSALASPLAKSLWAIEGVKGVFIAPEFITVNKDPEVDWANLRNSVSLTIMDFIASGKEIISQHEQRDDTKIKEGDSEEVQMIKEILETRVRPAVQEDGGDIVFKDFQDGVVFLKMQGSCSGCPSSTVTLKNGIERMLMHWIPEVTGVVAVDDDGKNHLKKKKQRILYFFN